MISELWLYVNVPAETRSKGTREEELFHFLVCFDLDFFHLTRAVSTTSQMFSPFHHLQTDTLKTLQRCECSGSVRTYGSASEKLLSDLCRSLILKLCCEAVLMYYSQQQPCACVFMCFMCVCPTLLHLYLTHHRHSGLLSRESVEERG